MQNGPKDGNRAHKRTKDKNFLKTKYHRHKIQDNNGNKNRIHIKQIDEIPKNDDCICLTYKTVDIPTNEIRDYT